MKFYGKILITDPCYIMTEKAWDEGIHEEDLSKYGNFIQHETGIGDISGGVFVDDKMVGDFGVDSGMFGVFQVDQLEKQPWFDKDKLDNLGMWCYTIIDGEEWEVDCVPEDESLESLEEFGPSYKFFGTKDKVHVLKTQQTGF